MTMFPDSTHYLMFADRDLLLDLVKGMAQLTTDIAEVKTDVAVLKTKATETGISLSATDIGANEIEKLKRLGCFLKFQPQSGDSILTKEQYAFVNEQIDSEKYLVDFINERLRPILKPRVLYSSEDLPWLWTSTRICRTKQKPDSFVCYRGVVLKKNVGTGVPAHEMLLEGLHIIDYKLERTDQAFGELVIHLQNLHANIRRHCSKDHLFVVKGALACKDGIWLVTVENTTVRHAETLSWIDQGGKNRLIEFFAEENPIADVVEALLKLFCRDLYDRPSNSTPFLGIGGCGCVFAVCDLDGHGRRDAEALKVVVGRPKIPLLKTEFSMNQTIASTEAGDIIVKASGMKIAIDGAGMLMSEVGVKVQGQGLKSRSKALDVLWKLHHAGFYHGDARMSNLLQCSSGYKWCDLQRAGSLAGLQAVQKQALLEYDIGCLVSSCGHEIPASNDLSRNKLAAYSIAMSLDSLLDFVSLICPRYLPKVSDGCGQEEGEGDFVVDEST